MAISNLSVKTVKHCEFCKAEFTKRDDENKWFFQKRRFCCKSCAVRSTRKYADNLMKESMGIMQFIDEHGYATIENISHEFGLSDSQSKDALLKLSKNRYVMSVNYEAFTRFYLTERGERAIEMLSGSGRRRPITIDAHIMFVMRLFKPRINEYSRKLEII